MPILKDTPCLVFIALSLWRYVPRAWHENVFARTMGVCTVHANTQKIGILLVEGAIARTRRDASLSYLASISAPWW